MPAQHSIKNLKLKIKNSLLSRGGGFTLVELMVAISIVAVLAAVGITSFSQSQKLGRDSKRKQDLRSLSVALELYRQKNGRYPCTGDAVWVNSSGGGVWINDTAFAACGGAAAVTLGTAYINRVPTDPLNTGAGSWTGVTTGYIYGYRGYDSTKCNTSIGQFYLLVAQLENKSDPDRNSVKLVPDCDGTALTGTGWDTAFVINSNG